MPKERPEFEIHDPSEQKILFVIERLDYDFKWRAAQSVQFKIAGKYIIYSARFAHYFKNKEEGPTLSFTDEALARQMAKALAHITDRPLRVERVQTIRLQRQIGKIILPTGGI